MTSKPAIYDMDSDDEYWMSKLNKEFQEHILDDDFESIVDALKKIYHYNPDDCCDEKIVTYQCKNLVGKNIALLALLEHIEIVSLQNQQGQVLLVDV